MDTEPPRQVLDLGLSALGGAAFWGLYRITMLLQAREDVEMGQWLRAGLAILLGVAAGILAAVFLGPALTPMVPIVGFRNAGVVGFLIGATAAELAPSVYRGVRAFGAKKAREVGE